MSETEKLIYLVRERPFLYDVNDPEYKNRPKRQATWREIADEMGSGNGDTWSAKWKGLKDNFAKYKKSSEPPYDENYKKYKNWPWVEHVRFLDECSFTSARMKYSSSTGSSSSAETNTEDSNDAEQQVPMKSAKKRRNKEETTSSEKENEKPRTIGLYSTFDETDHLFLSYAHAFKRFPTRLQILLKVELATLFAPYELKVAGLTPESIDNIPSVVPHPVKL